MGKGLLIMFILGTLCVSACGNVQKKGNIVELTKPQKLIVDETKTDALAKLQELKKVSEENYKLADNNTHVIEVRNRNMAKLKDYRSQVEKEAEEYIFNQKKQIEEEIIAGKKVFNVADGFLYACFDNNVSEETITAIAKKKPYYFVMRDSSMATDSVATNFDQIFATYSPDTERKVL